MIFNICFYVPPSHLEKVKNAMFAQGAGKIGQYSACAWQILGEGQFMPLEDSHSFIGDINQLEKTPEYKVEMVCDASCLQAVIAALKEAHPYEEPAFQVWQVNSY